MTPLSSSDPCLTAYQQIAPFYDDFTAHHDYELWLGNLIDAAQGLGLQGERLLDAACGTGKSFIPMLEQGWSVTATDLSPAMVAEAQRKAGAPARIMVADLRALPRLGVFDLIWALDDALNYLLTVDELEQALALLGQNLAPDGLLIFDVNTLLTYRTFFSERQRVSVGGAELAWEGRAESDFATGALAEASFTARAEDGETTSAVHVQRHHPPSIVRSALESAGLALLAEYGHGLDAVLEQPLDEERHTKAVFIARRHSS